PCPHITRRVLFIFFFQAEDGIRDKLVTGVQTCALPIFSGGGASAAACWYRWQTNPSRPTLRHPRRRIITAIGSGCASAFTAPAQIGRASCRERGDKYRGAGHAEPDMCRRNASGAGTQWH